MPCYSQGPTQQAAEYGCEEQGYIPWVERGTVMVTCVCVCAGYPRDQVLNRLRALPACFQGAYEA